MRFDVEPRQWPGKVHLVNAFRVGRISFVARCLVGMLYLMIAGGLSDADSEPGVPVGNITEGGVAAYREGVDYFPEKVRVQYAASLKVAYHGHYKVVTVLNPWRDAKTAFRYVLVQRGTPVPSGFDDAQVVEVPVNRLVVLSTTCLPHVDILDVEDRLVGISDFRYVSTPSIVERIQAGALVEVGVDAQLNMERMVDLRPDLVLAYGTGYPEYDVHPRLIEAGIPVALSAGYMETNPLGRCEWMKFTALFFNREAAAQAAFDRIAARYEELAALGRSARTKPTVLAGVDRQGTWHVPGGRSYVAALLADAGAQYLWADDPTTGSVPLDFEAVLERAGGADFWLDTGDWRRVADALAADERYTAFAALRSGNMFNCNARVNETGGNDYRETGVANPHLVLADLIRILHPHLLPDHELIWYRRLTPVGE